jgi:hypothetical protein
MIIKFLLPLFIAIIIGGIFATSLGGGLLGFKSTANAQKLVDQGREVVTAMQADQIKDPANLSIPYRINAGILTDNSTTSGDNAVLFSDVLAKVSDVEGYITNLNLKQGGFSVAVDTTSGTVALVNSSPEISDELCEQLNEVLGVSQATAGSADLTAAGFVDTKNSPEIPTTVVNAGLTASTAFQSLAQGKLEGVCVKDSGGNQNTFAIYAGKY